MADFSDPTKGARAAAELEAAVENLKATLKYCEEKWSEERGTMIDKIQAERLRADEYQARVIPAETEVVRLEGNLACAVAALEFFADVANWRVSGPLDPNSGNFVGRIHARAALAEVGASK